MKIIEYKFVSEQIGYIFSMNKIKINDINLFAGLSGVGKTRLLNTIYNLSLVIQKKMGNPVGNWQVDFSFDNKKYKYNLDLQKDNDSGKVFVNKEVLIGNGEKLIERNRRNFYFSGKELPKLSKEDIGIFLLREEAVVEKIFNEFKKIYIRRLNPVYYEKSQDVVTVFPKEILTSKKDKFTLEYISQNFNDVNSQLYLLKEFQKEIFAELEADFKEIFPFVEKLAIKPSNEVNGVVFPNVPLDTFIPVVLIKEKKVPQPIPIFRFSSGMMRALVQLVDVYTMPENSIYLIDEIENSMGIRSLPVMIDILLKFSKKIQFIFTTHHAYILNNVDIKYWRILMRAGTHIKVIDGKELKKKFSKSHQDAYIQLLNSNMIENGV